MPGIGNIIGLYTDKAAFSMPDGPGPTTQCKNCPSSGNPVNPLLGIKVLFGPDERDFELPAPLSLAWQRFYSSDDARVGLLGQGWVMPDGLELEVRAKRVNLIDGQGRRIPFGAIAPGHEVWSPYEQLGLRRGGLDPQATMHAAYRILPEAVLSNESCFVLRTLDGSLLVFEAPRAKRAGRRITPWPCTHIIDRNGFGIARHHDEQGRLAALEDSAGRCYRLALEAHPPIHRRDDGQRLVGVLLAHDPTQDPAWTDQQRKDWRNRSLAELARGLPETRWLVRYRYEHGDLVEVRNRSGIVVRQYRYDNHLLVAYRDAAGLLCEYRYDRPEPAGRVVWQSVGGKESQFIYEEDQTTLIDNLDRETTYRFSGPARSPLQRWEGITHADGSSEEFEYDRFGMLVGITDALRRRTTYELDAEGRVAAIVAADGTATKIAYAACGEPAEITDAAGNVRRMAYDERGNLIEEIDEAGHRTRYHYEDPALPNRPTRIEDARGGIKTLEWNRAGQMVAYTDCSNRQTRFDYDPTTGVLIRVTDALGYSRQYEVDIQGRITTLTNADGAVERFAYDTAGRLVEYQDGLGRRTIYGLDEHGRPLERIDALGHRLAYAWDEAGRLASLTNENGSSTSFRYDLRDRLIEETGFDGKVTQYAHNAAGELTEKHEAPGTPEAARILFGRDDVGRLRHKTSIAAKEARTTEYGYDPLGQLILAKNEDSRIEFSYDPRGLLLQERRIALGRDESLLHEVDALGNRTSTRLPNGRTVNWLHYGSGHLHQINLDGEVICDLERDALHREISRSQGALTSRYRLDAEGRLLHQFAEHVGPDKSAPLAVGAAIERRYAYDQAGQLQRIQDTRRGQTRYSYDVIGRLTEALHGDGQAERFAFDPAHNMVDVAGQTLPDNRLTVFEDKRYRYDSRGNLIEKRIGAHEVQHFRWDPDNQLVEARVTRPTGLGVTRYAYDPLGRRIAKLDGQGKARTVFMWDGNRLFLEASEKANTDTSRLYLYEPDSFAPMAAVDSHSATQRVLYFHCDHLGTPQEVSDTGGNVIWAADYAAWGKVRKIERPEAKPTPRGGPPSSGGAGGFGGLGATGLGGSSGARFPTAGNAALQPVFDDDAAANEAVFSAKIEQNLRFQGQYFDSETGLHYNRFRYYDPECGRYLSQDPIGLNGGDNLYQYASDPIDIIDPFGLAGIPKAGRYHGPKPQYENPGHHDRRSPNFRGGGSKTSLLPCHHQELAKHSVPDSAGIHWYAIDDRGVMHRFGNSNDGKMHWNGDTSQGRGIKVPPDVEKRLNQMHKEGLAVPTCSHDE